MLGQNGFLGTTCLPAKRFSFVSVILLGTDKRKCETDFRSRRALPRIRRRLLPKCSMVLFFFFFGSFGSGIMNKNDSYRETCYLLETFLQLLKQFWKQFESRALLLSGFTSCCFIAASWVILSYNPVQQQNHSNYKLCMDFWTGVPWSLGSQTEQRWRVKTRQGCTWTRFEVFPLANGKWKSFGCKASSSFWV